MQKHRSVKLPEAKLNFQSLFHFCFLLVSQSQEKKCAKGGTATVDQQNEQSIGFSPTVAIKVQRSGQPSSLVCSLLVPSKLG